MTDYLNKKIHFIQSKLDIRINKRLYSNGTIQFYTCSDVNNPSTTFSVKIVQVRSSDKAFCNSMNSEILILVKVN
jgi:hypothetical protein